MAQITKKDYLVTVRTGLTNQLAGHPQALPQGFNTDRFVLNAMTVVEGMMDDLNGIDVNSVVGCLAKGAFLGLDFFNGECYAIPYKGSIQFQTDYKGEIKLCKKYSKNPIKDIFAKIVREGDDFYEEVVGGVQNIIFRPKPFSDETVRGAFAVATFTDGSMLYEAMSKKEIEHVRDTYSKARNSPAWKNSPEEMYKKTVLRRLCKFIDLDFGTTEQMRAYDDGGDSAFDAGTLAANRRPVQEDPIDVLAAVEDMPQPDPQPVPDDFAEFEQQYSQDPPPTPEGFADGMDAEQEELPFN